MFTITGAWAVLITSLMPRDYPERSRIIRYAAALGLLGLVVALNIFSLWYLPALPEHARVILGTPAIPGVTFTVIQGGLLLTLLGLLFALAAPQPQRPLIAIGAMAVLFAAIFGAERTREVLRKPDIIHGYMSSNQLVMVDLPARGIWQEEALKERGMTGNQPFLQPPKAALSSGLVQAGFDPTLEQGRLLTLQQCVACCSVSPQTSVRLGGARLELRRVARLLEAQGQTTAAAAGIAACLNAIGGFPRALKLAVPEAGRWCALQGAVVLAASPGNRCSAELTSWRQVRPTSGSPRSLAFHTVSACRSWRAWKLGRATQFNQQYQALRGGLRLSGLLLQPVFSREFLALHYHNKTGFM
ncbi:MAG: hypothetical protein RMK51_11820 [Meiothermus sp.]|uniref:hypothetical protein n=1 Tax=Meiothermus sp. TaxID=1955249 RepID=UPI00298F2D1E|nr:hypothetical protein [Meiothermus sp.]MDW8426611.1 hypothetical protein [Meiothermus sp.]